MREEKKADRIRERLKATGEVQEIRMTGPDKGCKGEGQVREQESRLILIENGRQQKDRCQEKAGRRKAGVTAGEQDDRTMSKADRQKVTLTEGLKERGRQANVVWHAVIVAIMS